jgi:hypothetical protein
MTGKVYDKETGKPIANATVNLLENKDIAQTDSNGYFEVYTHTGSHKTSPMIIVSKKGYKSFQLRVSYSDGENSYSVKSETEYIKYKDTLFLNLNKTSYLLGVDIEKWSNNFSVGDTLKIYLTRENVEKEVEKIQTELKSQKW